MSFELPGYRECDGTYCFFPYEELPRLDETLWRGEFQWLTQLDDQRRQALELHQQTSADQLNTTLNALLASAEALPLRLPAAFVTFMGRPDLREQIPSCTACYFDLAQHIVKSPVGAEGYLIRFLNDQQGVLYWYLYLNAAGQEAVVVSPILFDAEDLEAISTEAILRNVGFCGESFEAFLYRFWLENTLWFALSDGQALTEAQEHYVKHYQ